jgi:hypothetical protein
MPKLNELLAAERAELAGDYRTAAAAYRALSSDADALTADPDWRHRAAGPRRERNRRRPLRARRLSVGA